MEQYLYLAVFALYGLIIGSFLNVCIYRIPLGLSVAAGRSFCPDCRHTLRAPDLVPVFSYLLQRGRCRYCGQPISPRYMLVESLTALLFALAYCFMDGLPAAVLACLLLAVLVVVAFIDLDTQEIPDVFHIIILTLSIIHLWIDPAPLWQNALGMVIVAVPMLGLACLTGGFGGADIKLMAVAGLYLGAGKIVFAFLAGAVLGGAYALLLLARKQADKKTAIPFCPFLAVGIAVALLWGDRLISAYLSLF